MATRTTQTAAYPPPAAESTVPPLTEPRESSPPPPAQSVPEWEWDSALQIYVNVQGYPPESRQPRAPIAPPALGFCGPPMPTRPPPYPRPRPHPRGGSLLIWAVWEDGRLVSC